MLNTLNYRELLKLRVSLLMKKGEITFIDTAVGVKYTLYKTFKQHYPEKDVEEVLNELEVDILEDIYRDQDNVKEIPEDFKLK